MDDTISCILFRRVNPEKNEARFYYLCIGPSLFDAHAVVRLWGRIGGHQRGMLTPCASAEEAQALFSRLVRRRVQRGYRVISPETLGAGEGETHGG